MPLQFVTPEERLKQQSKINVAMFGPAGVGKTFQARTLDPDTTLFIDGEAGTLSLGDWHGTVLDIRKEATRLGAHPWEICRAIACLLGGPDPANPDGPYGQASYDAYVKHLAGGDPNFFDRFDTVFMDSITVASRWSFSWSQKQPEAFSEKTGKPDTRGAYGLHGRQMIEWLTVLQHQPKSIIVVGILDEKEDDFGRLLYTPQIVGSAAGRELPGIFDCVVTLQNFATEDGISYRAFVTNQDNPKRYPAKTRGGFLDPLEPPDLGKLLAKIGRREPVSADPITTMPTEGEVNEQEKS